jgi:hypothetical protein
MRRSTYQCWYDFGVTCQGHGGMSQQNPLTTQCARTKYPHSETDPHDDFIEIFSPQRVCKRLREFGCRAYLAVDVLTGLGFDGQRHDTKWTTGPGGIVLSVTGVVRPLCATLPIGTLADESSGIPQEPRSIVIDRGLPFK